MIGTPADQANWAAGADATCSAPPSRARRFAAGTSSWQTLVVAPLEAYRAKRKTAQTPEPFGSGTDRSHLFVVQAHAARRMHFDFRLELGGVLRSWAVPQGPSMDPSVKRLAVEVEDHPVEYADFEGVIPQGNYGAGPVIVWDRGAWQPLEDPIAGIESGKLVFALSGVRLRGAFELIRLKKAKEWLLFKKKDKWAGVEREPPKVTSILSGRTLDELREGQSAAAAVTADLERLKAPRREVNGSTVKVMLADSRDKAFSAPDWLFELKYDGFRGVVARRDSQVSIHYRSGNDATNGYPDLLRALRALPYPRIVLDGELVVLDDEGRADFQRLQRRALLTRSADVERATVSLPITYYAFDLLGFDGFDLRGLPLVDRKRLLEQLVPRVGIIRYADHVPEQGEALLEQVRARGLEGIIAKRAHSKYVAGRSADWVKVRLEKTEDYAVVGFTKPKGSRSGFGALHLAIFESGEWIYSGRVGTGFSDKQLDEIFQILNANKRAAPPCKGNIPPGADHVWVNPTMVVEVRYHERTDDGLLRQPAFLRVRTDKSLTDLSNDAPVEPAAVSAPPQSKPDAAQEPERRVPFSNLTKIYWPDDGITKGDLIDYYREIGPWLLPYLRDRPLVMTRYPDGIAGKNFYQKDAPGFAPAWLRTTRIYAEDAQREIDYFVCDELDSLLYVANLGSIPLHIWSSRVSSLQMPDYCIIDLDPKAAPFSSVIALAQAVHRLCDEIELPCYVKTSGQSGIHVLISLGRQCTYAQSRGLGNVIARVLEARHPDIATTQRVISARGDKVYLDYLQNGHGQTIAAPFSVRPRPGAPVSMPLDWKEVNASLTPGQFTLRNAIARMAKRRRDPMLPVLEEAPDLVRAIERLSRFVK